MTADLTTFAEMVKVLDDLPVILLNARRARRQSGREVGRQLGIAGSTISRLEAGGELSTTSLRALLVWLDATPQAEATR